ncbi:MAG: response regulator transcription factor [Gemmatimonadota bacterium]
MRRAAILICDDHPLMSQGLKALLRPGFIAAGVVNDGREVLEAIRRTSPDVLLLDLSMPHRNGLDLIPEIRELAPTVKILIVTMHVDRALADLAIQSGAHGFIPKEASADELNEAIDAVLRSDRPFISPRVPRRSFRDGSAVHHPGLDKLTPRHREILVLIGAGRTSVEISEQLGLSARTIEFHRASIRRALGITTESALMRFALMLQVAPEPEDGEAEE